MEWNRVFFCPRGTSLATTSVHCLLLCPSKKNLSSLQPSFRYCRLQSDPALAASSAPTPKAAVTFHWIASHSVFQRGGYTEEPDWMQSSKMQPHQHRGEEYPPSLSFSPRCSPARGRPLLPQGSIAGLHSTLGPQGTLGPSPQSCSPAS